MMQQKIKILPELLAPAGSPDALAAAIEGGADAVYFGSVRFSARMRAKNFDETEITDAITMCRTYGVRSYITVNTRLRDSELPEMLDTVGVLYKAGADALIIADHGAAALIRERYPDIELHASTQMSGCSAADARVLRDLGFSRMVCAREMSLSQITDLCAASPIEIEMFIHGAHCVSYSGQCLYSYAMGGRSGNRGECAQPCRLPCRISSPGAENRSAYPISLKDMCTAAHISDIIRCGAASLKIEGRQKSAEYVYGVTSIYRKLLDEKRNADKDEIEALADLFNRDGFSDGYLRGNYKNMLGIRRKEDAKKSRQAASFSGLTKKIPLTGTLTVRRGCPITFSVTAGNTSVTVCGDIPDEARTVPLDDAGAQKSLCKFGGTPYTMQTLHTEIDPGLFCTPAQLNLLRRNAVSALQAAPERRILPPPERPKSIAAVDKPVFTAEFLSPDRIPEEAHTFFSEIWLPAAVASAGCGISLPPYATDQSLAALADTIHCKAPSSLLVHSPAQLAMAKSLGVPCTASFRLNVFNNRCAEEITALGADTVTVSPEIPLGAIRAMTPRKAVVAYGRLPLLTMLRCALSDGGKLCRSGGTGGYREGNCRTSLCIGFLSDRTGTDAPLVGMYDCTNVLYNSVPLYMADRMDVFRGCSVSAFHFIFSTETASEAAEIIRAYRLGLPPANPQAIRRIR